MTTTPTTKEERERWPQTGLSFSDIERLIADVDRPRVYVNSPARNIGDPRPVRGFYPLIREYPNHACGPCMEIADEHGATTVNRHYCVTGDDIENMRSTVDRLTREVEKYADAHDRWTREASEALAARDAAQQQRDDARNERDAANEARDLAEAETAAAQAKLGEVERERDEAIPFMVAVRDAHNGYNGFGPEPENPKQAVLDLWREALQVGKNEGLIIGAANAKLATLEAKGGEGQA